jgi:hypothetical protein
VERGRSTTARCLQEEEESQKAKAFDEAYSRAPADRNLRKKLLVKLLVKDLPLLPAFTACVHSVRSQRAFTACVETDETKRHKAMSA